MYGIDGAYPIAVLDREYLNLRPCAGPYATECYPDEECAVFEDGSAKCVQRQKYSL